MALLCYATQQQGSSSVVQASGSSLHLCFCFTASNVSSHRRKRRLSENRSILYFSADENARQAAVVLPTWLQNEQLVYENEGAPMPQNQLQNVAQRNVAILKSYLEYSRRFMDYEIDDVMDALIIAADGDMNKLAGAANFLWLLSSVDNTPLEASIADDTHETSSFQNMMSRDALIASAFHYCDCVTARNSGVYEIIEEAVKMSSNTSIEPSIWQSRSSTMNKLLLSSPENRSFVDIKYSDGESTSSTSRKRRQARDVNRFGEEVSKITMGAARIKRAEVLADTVISTSARSNAGSLQNLLVTVSEDWRALAIRSVASLYRLKGIIAFRKKMAERSLSGSSDSGVTQLSKPLALEEVKLSREALTVYAPLAQRLGMQRLKNELEGTAFRLLYPRQYNAAMSLYKAEAPDMYNIAHEIRSEIENFLSNDEIILSQANSVSVVARVKEPYSLWRKLLKFRMKSTRSLRQNEVNTSDSGLTFSLLDVHDAIAVRVIVEPYNMKDYEHEETSLTVEKLLCYYIQQKCIDRWPVSDSSRIKDYIANPKDNGYQSLHHTSSFFRYGVDWPFEVQVRSKSMHKLAEFGVAAHWDYKLQSKGVDVGATSLSVVPSKSKHDLVLSPGNAMKSVSNKRVDLIEMKEAKARADRLAPYLDALTDAQANIKNKLLYVFVSPSCSSLDGKLLPIPKGSKILHALEEYQVLSDSYGDIFLNGIQVVQDIGDVILKNGDVITLRANL